AHAEADRPESDRVPLCERTDDTAGLRREVDTGGEAESECMQVCVQIGGAELARHEYGAGILRPREDLRDGRRAIDLALRIAEGAPADDRIAHVLIARGRSDDALVDRGRDRDRLQGRSGLVGPRDPAVAEGLGARAAHPRGVICRRRRHREPRAIFRIEDDDRAARRFLAFDDRRELTFRSVLHRQIDGQPEVVTVLRRHRRAKPEGELTVRRIAGHGEPTRYAGKRIVVAAFDAVLTKAVVVDEAEDLGAHGTIRVEALRLHLEAESTQTERGDPGRGLLGETPPYEEPLRATVERGAKDLDLLAEYRRERRRDHGSGVVALRVLHLRRDRVQRAELYGRRQDRAAPVTDDSALRGDREITADLVCRAAKKLAASDRLPVGEPRREKERRHGEEREEDAKTRVRDRGRHPSPPHTSLLGCPLPADNPVR